MTDAPKIDTQAPERIIAWPGSYPHYEPDDWMNAECRGEAEAGPDADYGTWYVRADLADARAAAAAQAMREAAVALIDRERMAAAMREQPSDEKLRLMQAAEVAILHHLLHAVSELPLPAPAALDRLIAERVREAVDRVSKRFEGCASRLVPDDYAQGYHEALEHIRDAARGSKEGQS